MPPSPRRYSRPYALPPDVTVYLRFLDLAIEVRSDDRDLLGLVSELWEPFVVDGGDESKHSIRIDRDGHRWAIQVDGNVPLEMFDPWVVLLDLRTVIDELIVNSIPDAVDLHAAMAHVDGSAVLFPGDPGAGKTTLLVAGLERGWQMLCDDLSLLDLETSQIVPMPRPIGVRLGVPLSDFSERWAPPAWLGEPTTPYLVPASVFPLVETAVSVSPTAVVFPRFDRTGVTASIGLSRAQTLARLGRHVAPLTPQTIAALNRLADSAEGLDLTYSDPAEGVEAVETALPRPER